MTPELRRDQSPLERLSHREKQILTAVLSGLPSKVIADELGLSPSTVDNHRANIRRKLGARTSADLARIVLTEPGFRSPKIVLLPEE